MKEKTQTIALRAPLSLVKRIDAYAEQLSARADGVAISRTDAMMTLMLRALDTVEDEAKKPANRRG